MYVYILPSSVSLYYVCAWNLQRTEDVRSPGIGADKWDLILKAQVLCGAASAPNS